MMQFAIQEPKIEQFFNHSKEEILKALEFIVDNNIRDFNTNTSQLSTEQKKELDSRIESFHNNPSIGRSWNEIKHNLTR